MIPWWKQKTTWTAVIAVITAVGAFVGGEITLVGLIPAILAAIGAIFMRQGIEKSTYIPPMSERGEEVK